MRRYYHAGKFRSGVSIFLGERNFDLPRSLSNYSILYEEVNLDMAWRSSLSFQVDITFSYQP